MKSTFITEKDYVPGQSEEEFYNMIQTNYKLRNDSFVHDLFYGKFRSVTTCPKCDHVSLKFEAYNMLSLPIKVKSDKNVRFSFYLMFKYTLFSLSKINAIASKSDTLVSFKSRFLAHHKIAFENFRFYYFDDTTKEMTALSPEDKLTIEYFTSKSNSKYIFLIEDKNEMMNRSPGSLQTTSTSLTTNSVDQVQVFIKIHGINQKLTQYLTKPVLCSNKVSVSNVYKFVYECLDRQAKNYLDSFDIEFQKKEGHVFPFEIYVVSGKNSEVPVVLQKIDDEGLVELKEADTILVKINNKDLRTANELNSLVSS